MTGDEIRNAFLRFFEEKGHTVLPSSSLVPQDDPTLLLTTAGMVQIKPYFMGLAAPPNPRLASCQKCFRTTDIVSVGDAKHLTFFEMLGNFSVGDYFKKEAIAWAWEFVTVRLGLPPERLWITIFLDDDEAFDLWRRIGIPPERIVRCGEKDNFWGPAGDSGPCGPCSEIHYDFGSETGCGRDECNPACGCSRFLEIWNLVFTQYDQDREGKRTLLPRPNIDTGMGLERAAVIMQGKPSVYETDIFGPIISQVCRMSGKKYGQSEQDDRAVRIVAEHGRAVTFLISDGVAPGNEGRGYVLRRILRRAVLFGRKLGISGSASGGLGEVADVVISRMGQVYPELPAQRRRILQVIQLEEERFSQALDTGLGWLDKAMQRGEESGRKNISGEEAFRLYDTYGFPSELTAEIAGEQGFSVDLDGFKVEMERQRERARAAQRFSGGRPEADLYRPLLAQMALRTENGRPPSTKFTGYHDLAGRGRVLGLLVGKEAVETAYQGQDVEVVLDRTPFYGEMGGQVGDSGRIQAGKGKVDVSYSIRPLPEMVVHCGKVAEGSISVGDEVEAAVDEPRRQDIARNHTATHLLQAALRSVLGPEVCQAGSLVTPDRFRFDFTRLAAVNKGDLAQVQHMVNERIRENLAVRARSTTYAEALSRGVIALFGEKYGDDVRSVEIGEPPISMELCGGTHVAATGEIGLFHILSESSVGSGLRRIEALTGRGAERFLEEAYASLETASQQMQAASPSQLPERASALLAELERERKRAAALEQELARREADALLSGVQSVDGVNLVAARVPAGSLEALRAAGDRLRESLHSGVVVLGAVYNDRPNFVVMVSGDLTARGFHAGAIVKRVAQVTGGGGGGKPEMGQGSGKDSARMQEALDQAGKLLKENKA